MSESNGASPPTRRRKADIAKAEAKPSTLTVNPDGIAGELKALPQWVCWRLERRDGKWTKVPSNPRTRANAEPNNPSTWGTFAEALALHHRDRERYAGVGFMFREADPYAGVDLDDCRDPDTGGMDSWATELLDDLDGHTDLSPSGTGVKVIVQGCKPGKRCRAKYAEGEVEIYDHDRFFALTGHLVPGHAADVPNRQASLESLYHRVFPEKKPAKAQAQQPTNGKPAASKRFVFEERGGDCPLPLAEGELARWRCLLAEKTDKIKALWGGDTSAHNGDDSRADASLCKYLLILTNGDRARAELLFGESDFGKRPKWTDRQDYRDLTFEFALSGFEPWKDDPADRKPRGGRKGDRKPGGPPNGFTLGTLTLRPGLAHKSPSGKVSIPLAVLRGAQAIDHTTLSSTASGRAAVVKLLAGHLGEGADPQHVAVLLGEVLAAAVAELERQAEGEQLQLCDIVRSEVPAAWGLAHRTERGAWSEVRKADVGRAEFLAFTPGWLLDAAAMAADAPRTFGGSSCRPALLAAVRSELEILWAGLIGQLGTVPEADQAAEASAESFVAAMQALWNAPRIGERVILSNGETAVVPSSLASRARERTKEHETIDLSGRVAWVRIHVPFCAWWRPQELPDGERVVRLALHWTLTAQLGVRLPGVRDQASVNDLGRRFGFLDADHGLPDRPSGGTDRLAILTVNHSRDLLDDPASWTDGDSFSDTTSCCH